MQISFTGAVAQPGERAFAMLSSRVRSSSAPPPCYISKPFESDCFIAVVREYLVLLGQFEAGS